MSVHWRFYPRVCWGNRRQREHWLVAAASFLLPSMLSRSELSPHIKLLNGFQYKHFFADLLLLLFLCFGISHRSGLALFLPFFCHLKLNEHSNRFFFLGKKHLDFCQTCIIIFHHPNANVIWFYLPSSPSLLLSFLLSSFEFGWLFIVCACECLDHQISSRTLNTSIMMQSEYTTDTHTAIFLCKIS